MGRWMLAATLLCAAVLAAFLLRPGERDGERDAEPSAPPMGPETPADTAPSPDDPAPEASPAPRLVGVEPAPEGDVDRRSASKVRGRIVDAEGTPIPGLAVRVGRSRVPIVCDEQARFVVQLGPGTHTLRALHSGVVPIGDPVQVHVRVGTPTPEVQIRVPRSWSISGHVVNRANEPVPGVLVAFQSTKPGSSANATWSQKDGSFTIRVWAPGSYTAAAGAREVEGVFEAGDTEVTLRHDPEKGVMRIRILGPLGRLVPEVKLTVKTGTERQLSIQEIDVTGGIYKAHVTKWGPFTELKLEQPRDEDGDPLPFAHTVVTEVDLTRTQLDIRMAAARTVVGRVVDDSGTPVPGIKVTVFDPTAKAAGRLGRATSDEDGAFEIGHLPPTRLQLYPKTRNTAFHRTEGVIIEPTQASATIRLRRADVYRVTVLDDKDQPVPNVTAHVSWVRKGIYEYRRGATGIKGEVTLEGVPSDLPLVVHVLTEGHPKKLPAFKKVGVPYGDGTITIRLSGGAAIEGDVVDHEGRLGGGGEVVAEGIDEDNRSVTSRVRPDKHTGRFALHGLKPGRYRVWIHERAGSATSQPMVITAPAASVRLVAPAPATIRGKIVDDAPTSWRVTWFMEPRAARAAPRKDGSFEIPAVREERGSLLARKPGDARIALLEHVRPSEGPFVLRPKKGQQIAGQIEGLDAKAAEHSYVALRRGPVVLTTAVDKTLQFQFASVPPGTWRIEVFTRRRLVGSREGVDAGTSDVRLTARE